MDNEYIYFTEDKSAPYSDAVCCGGVDISGDCRIEIMVIAARA